MALQSDEARGQTACAIDVSPTVVDAGAELTLQGKVVCSPACDLRGHTLSITQADDGPACSVALTEFDGVTNETREFVVKAPVTTGAYTWLLVCPAVVRDGTSYEESSAPVSFTVKPHTTSVAAWDLPPTIEPGERFRIKVGIKCSGDCPLTNRDFGIYDHEGRHVATGMLSDDRWPGTTGLHVAEVELEAPAAEGLYTWSARSPASDVAIPHDEGSISFGVRVVSHPECLVTVETVDEVSRLPLTGARVVMHPYRAVTDEHGVAEVRVAKGAYKLFVSQTGYLTFGLPVEVSADITTRAELCVEPAAERN